MPLNVRSAIDNFIIQVCQTSTNSYAAYWAYMYLYGTTHKDTVSALSTYVQDNLANNDFSFNQSVNPEFLSGSNLDQYVLNILNSCNYIVLRVLKTRSMYLKARLGYQLIQVKSKHIVLELFRHNRARKYLELGKSNSEIIALMNLRNENHLGYYLNSVINTI